VPAVFDVSISALLDAWAPRLGRPTCGPGCARCCRRMSVIMTSAEAAQLVASPEFETFAVAERAQRLRQTLTPGVQPDDALDALLDLGPCVFLRGKRCGVYAERPDGCRAAFVWHDAWYCGRPEYDQCVPAELNALRVARVYERMLAEFAAGRRPFWGQILPAVALLAEHAEAYRRGDDLSAAEPAWTSADLVEFPGEARLISERDEHRRLFAEEPHPLGSPRAAEAQSRADLAPFRFD
jgi:Fe-S-cluster containining protein